LILALGMGPGSLPAAAQTSGSGLSREDGINVDKRAVGRMPILVEEFNRGSGATVDDTRAVFDVLYNDLWLTGFFKLVKISALGPDEALPASTSLALVRGSVDVVNGEIVLSGTVEGLPGRDLLFSRTYRTRTDAYRETAHRFADDVVEHLTEYPGIARTRIAFISSRTGNKEIYVVDYDGYGLRQVTRNGSINLSPAWHPGGREIAFVSYQGGDADIYVVDVATGKERRLVGGKGVQGAPAYSPDGQYLLFSQTRGSESEIYICRSDGSGVRRLTRAGGINTSPAWSPDGRRIVFTSDRSGNPQLYVTDAEGASPRRITFQGTWNDIADWSPGGDRIAYSSRREGGFQVALVGASGLEAETLYTFGPGSDEHPTWSPDGRHLAFASSRDGAPQVFVLDADGGSTRSVARVGGSCSGAAWSPVPPR
jgi:TolB protein